MTSCRLAPDPAASRSHSSADLPCFSACVVAVVCAVSASFGGVAGIGVAMMLSGTAGQSAACAGWAAAAASSESVMVAESVC